MPDEIVPAGWYSDPNDLSRLRWWDGKNWQDHFAPAAPQTAAVDTAPVGRAASIAPPMVNAAQAESSSSAPARTLMDHAVNFVNDPRLQGGVIGATGAAVTAGGAASLIRNDAIRRNASKAFLIGVVIFVLGVFGVFLGFSQMIGGPTEVTTSGNVTKIQSKFLGDCIPTVEFLVQGQAHTTRPNEFTDCIWEVGDSVAVTYDVSSGGTIARLGTSTSAVSSIPYSFLMMVSGVIVAAWALIPIAIRAGSIVGGIYLIRQGLRRSKN